jgi:branched-chain amino acid transport system substrate-binding protein
VTRRRTRTAALLIALGLVVPACDRTDPPVADTPAAKIAFFQDLSVDDSIDLVSPSFLALDLRLRQARDEGVADVPLTVQFDTGGDPAMALEEARTVAQDPTYVAAVIAPFFRLPADASQVLASAQVATLSLSSLTGSSWSSSVRGGGPFLALVGRVGRQADLLAAQRSSAAATNSALCVTGDPSSWSDAFQASLLDALPPRTPTVIPTGASGTVGAAVRSTGCHQLVWTGGTTGAVTLRNQIPSSVKMSGSDAMRTAEFLAGAASRGDGTVATCSCADANLSIALPAQRFVNTYQADTGLAPGMYAAEGWDLGGILLGFVRLGASDRPAVTRATRNLRSYDGVVRAYRFGPSGQVVPNTVAPGVYAASGTRWIRT